MWKKDAQIAKVAAGVVEKARQFWFVLRVGGAILSFIRKLLPSIMTVSTQHAVENGGSHLGIVVLDFLPTVERLVLRDDNGVRFVALADDLEKQVGAALSGWR